MPAAASGSESRKARLWTSSTVEMGELLLGAGAKLGLDEIARHQHRPQPPRPAAADIAGLDARPPASARGRSRHARHAGGRRRRWLSGIRASHRSARAHPRRVEIIVDCRAPSRRRCRAPSPDPRARRCLTARAVPKCISSARLRPGPMPGTSSSGLAAMLLARFCAVGADREAVRLVAQPLEVEEHRRIGRQRDLAPARQMEDLAAGIAVRPLGDADHRHVVDAGILQHLADRARAGPCRRRSAAGPAIRPSTAVRILLLEPGEAAAEHLAHHREIVAGRGLRPLDVELAIGVLAEALRARRRSSRRPRWCP